MIFAGNFFRSKCSKSFAMESTLSTFIFGLVMFADVPTSNKFLGSLNKTFKNGLMHFEFAIGGLLLDANTAVDIFYHINCFEIVKCSILMPGQSLFTYY